MKKILALLLTVGMVLGLFAGCGNSNTTPAGTAANPTAAAAAASARQLRRADRKTASSAPARKSASAARYMSGLRRGPAMAQPPLRCR